MDVLVSGKERNTLVPKARWYRAFKRIRLHASLILNFQRMYLIIHFSNCVNFMKKDRFNAIAQNGLLNA